MRPPWWVGGVGVGGAKNVGIFRGCGDIITVGIFLEHDMSMHRAGRVVTFLPLFFFGLFLYELRAYSAGGWGPNLALAGLAGLACLGLVGAIIYRQYDRPRLCGCDREDEAR